ncbi:MAG TPA: hypothetical protein VKR27_07720, partial [Acidimicrobiales bacterium]|nr:hypothetical protein [Acidimicrobiales bacterium]
MRGTSTLPLVEVTINGHGPFHLLLDLGSNVFLLRRDVAVASGAQVLVHRQQRDRDIIACDSLRIGEALFREVVGGVYEQLDVDGVISYPMLRNLLVVLDFPARTFALSRDTLRAPTTGEIDVRFEESPAGPLVP